MTEPTQYSPDPSLTADQQRVLLLLAEGNSIHAASQAVGIHRNTVRNWRRTLPVFAQQAELAVREQAIAWHDQALVLAPLAAGVLHEVLRDREASQPLRARIAIAILKMAADPKLKSLRLADLLTAAQDVVQPEISETCTIAHNPAPLTQAA